MCGQNFLTTDVHMAGIGWTKLQAINSLLKKGGYKEHITEEFRKSISLVRYQSEKSIVTYEEYCRYRRKHRSS